MNLRSTFSENVMTNPIIALGCCTLIFTAPAPISAADAPKPITQESGDASQTNIENSTTQLNPIAPQWANRVYLAPQRFELANSAPLPVAGYIDAQRQWLAAQIDDASDPGKKMAARLTAANWELAAAAATPVSYILLGFEAPTHRDQLRELTQAANQHFRQVDEQLEAAGDLPDDQADALALHLMRLRAFAQILAALAESADVDADADADAEKSIDDMLTATAILLEDSRPDVVATAELYQGFLLGRAGRSERALKILKWATAGVAPGTTEFAVMGKLVRLRLLNASGMTDAAWALSLRLGEQLPDWISSKPVIAEARAGLALLRLDTMTQARDRAKTAGNEDESKWLTDRIQSLDEELFSENPPAEGLFRLSFAVPMLTKIERRPANHAILDLQTAASSVVVVVDLSESVTNAQRNTLFRQLETDLGKLGETQRFSVMATCQSGPCFPGDPQLLPAGADAVQTAIQWLADRKTDQPSSLSAALDDAMKLSTMQILVLTDRPYDPEWGETVAKSAQTAKVEIDVIQIRGEDQLPPPASFSAPGIRVKQIERQAPPKPAAPPTDQNEEPDEPRQSKKEDSKKQPSLTQSDDVDDR
jgi:hypothetical protein